MALAFLIMKRAKIPIAVSIATILAEIVVIVSKSSTLRLYVKYR